MRCFIAITLDAALKQDICRSIAKLKNEDCDVKWVDTENLHITLKFLGATGEDLIPAIKEKLLRITESCPSFQIKICGSGVLPDKRRPRVIMLNLTDSGRMKDLQKDIELEMDTLGFKREDRAFHPHLTIGRVRSPRGREHLLDRIETLKAYNFGNIEVRKISLMKSELTGKGSQYTYIADFNLRQMEGR